MNVHLRHLAAGAALIVLAACGPPEENSADVADEPAVAAPTGVELAVITAQAIRALPTAADSILAAHGLTRAGFDSLMYEIAADSARAETYAAAMR